MKFNKEQLELIKKLAPQVNINRDFSEEDLLYLDDIITEHLIENCIEDDKPNEEGKVCEQIINMLAEV